MGRSKVERLARALCVELARVTDGRPMKWRMLDSLAKELKFTDDEMFAAIVAAAKRGWIDVDPLAARGEAPPHSVCLTEEGRRPRSPGCWPPDPCGCGIPQIGYADEG